MALKTVKDMYVYARDNNMKLLSNYPSAFWSGYITNSVRLDRMFCRMYRSFYYFLAEENDEVDITTDDFIDAVYSLLLMNDKKYTELYRVFTLSDSDLSPTKGYSMKEITDRDSSKNNTLVEGARTDTKKDELGDRDDSYTHGSRTDNETIGSRTDNETLGSRSDSGSFTKGSETDTDTITRFAFDSNNWANDTQDTKVEGQRSDSNSSTKGQQDNDYTYGQQDNDYTKGSQSDSSSIGEQENNYTMNKGQQTNLENEVFKDDVTVTAEGTPDRQSAMEQLAKFNDFWSAYEFYQIIFRDICRELLSITADV